MTIDQSLSTSQIAERAEEAYTYAFPMLMGYRFAFGTSIAKGAASYRGALNEIHSDPKTLGPSFRDVITPNADTPYSFSILDLRVEPMVLHVPQITDRYYVMQLEDLYGFNAHYVGTRVTGTDAGAYLLPGPRWDGPVPDGISAVLRGETDLAFLIGRTQLLGASDLPALESITGGYRLEALSSFLGSTPPPAVPFDWPMWDDEASRDERFVDLVNVLLELCLPPNPQDEAVLATMASIGIAPGVPFDAADLSEYQRDAFRAGIASAREMISSKVDEAGEMVNGWTAVDSFGDRARIGADITLRAAGAMMGWGGNDKKEAFYPICRTDADGEPLNGGRRYRLTFTDRPPVDAFWSVTMYDTSYDGVGGYMVDNPIDRYLVSSTTEGLSLGEDGSLTIAIQRDEPTSATDRANWLPAPDGDFYLVLRMYLPKPAALDGSWSPPPLVKID
ncbi:MAG: DUF1254 domain-containing protein [Chloroflexota bacterium]